jgi:hypothetical protein
MPDTERAELGNPRVPCRFIVRVSPLVIAALYALHAPLFAEPAVKAARHARFLAVGDSPPFRQVIRDGVRYELEPPPGSIPPREVVPGFAGKPSEPVPLRLGRIGPRVVVPPGEGPLPLWRAGDAADASPWATLNHPETGDFLVLFWRGPATGSWDDGVSTMALAETPAGMARIVNLFPQAVIIEWGEETLQLPAGRSIRRPVPRDAPVALRILAKDGQGAVRRYYSSAVSATAGERCLVTIHRADGAAPRRPLKVAVLREPAQAPPGPNPAAPANRRR